MAAGGITDRKCQGVDYCSNSLSDQSDILPSVFDWLPIKLFCLCSDNTQRERESTNPHVIIRNEHGTGIIIALSSLPPYIELHLVCA